MTSSSQGIWVSIEAGAVQADELKKLAELNHAGALTDEEFAAAKQQLIGGS